MRIAVIGAGIVGVTSAYELAADGHEVTVFERLQGVASEASFANSGVVAPGYVGPWAAPWMPLKVLAGLFGGHSAVRFGWGALGSPGWLGRYLLACRTHAHRVNRQRMQRLALYSRQRLDQLTQRHGLEYEQRRGYMVLLRSERELARARRGLAILQEIGVTHAVLDPRQARSREPGIAPSAPLHAALALPDDIVANCRQFAQALKHQAQQRGARFQFGAEIRRLSASHPGRLYWQATEQPAAPVQQDSFDAIVLCTGRLPASLGDRLGVRLPVMAVNGYSMTAPIRHREGEPDPGPSSGVMDERHKVSITRLGQRVRAAGIAEVGVDPQRMREQPLASLYKVLEEWFPGAADLSKVQHWKGARPMMPDGPPVIGGAGPARLWLNLGHGGSGWALSCGSARVLADLVGGRQPDLDVEGLGIARLR